MNTPSAPPAQPGVPPPPAPLNRSRLWLSLLGPSLALILFFVAAASLPASITNISFFGLRLGEGLWGAFQILALGSWGLFIHTIAKRYSGNSLVFLILAYPIGQLILLAAIFYAGCLLSS